MISTPIPLHACRKCGYKMDETTEAYGEARPKVGDVSICAKCGELALFTEGLAIRAPTPQELVTLNADPKIIKAQIYIRGYPRK